MDRLGSVLEERVVVQMNAKSKIDDFNLLQVLLSLYRTDRMRVCGHLARRRSQLPSRHLPGRGCVCCCLFSGS